MDGAACEGREDKAMSEGFMGGKAQIVDRWCRHDDDILLCHMAG